MKLFEFEAKNEFSKHNIPVPNGTLAATPEQASGDTDRKFNTAS